MAWRPKVAVEVQLYSLSILKLQRRKKLLYDPGILFPWKQYSLLCAGLKKVAGFRGDGGEKKDSKARTKI